MGAARRQMRAVAAQMMMTGAHQQPKILTQLCAQRGDGRRTSNSRDSIARGCCACHEQRAVDLEEGSYVISVQTQMRAASEESLL